MDLDLMINSFPKLLSATLTTLKLLSLSLIFWFNPWFDLCYYEIKQE